MKTISTEFLNNERPVPLLTEKQIAELISLFEEDEKKQKGKYENIMENLYFDR